MNKRIDFTNIGGFPFTQGTLEFMQDSYRDGFGALCNLFEDKTIISGVVVNDLGTLVTDGWIIYNGELIKFIGGTPAAKVIISEITEDRVFQDASTHTVYYTKVAQCGAVGDFNFSELKPHSPIWASGDLKQVDCDDAYIAANFDNTGKGKNERRGWAICNGNNGTKNRGGLVSIGYDTRTIDPATGWWDILYNSMGTLVGEMKHTLTVAELPAHDHGLPVESGGAVDRQSLTTSANADEKISEADRTGSAGSGDAHENRQKSIVTLFIQKI